MIGRDITALSGPIRRLFGGGTVSGMAEGEMLARFAARRDEAAFGAIVDRHGPMVLSVCRRWLDDPNDVDDAFQATFLVLVRRAGSLRDRDLLGNWLFGVAQKVAKRARADAARRRGRERVAAEAGAAAGRGGAMPDQTQADDHRPLYEEIARLPGNYRSTILLCDLQGLTHAEAADRLGWPVGTVKGRQARARGLLRDRLARRGCGPAAIAPIAPSLVSEALRTSTLRAALSLAAGRPLAASATAAALAEGVNRAMMISKLQATASIALAGSLVAGVGAFARQDRAKPAGEPAPAAVAKPAAGPAGGPPAAIGGRGAAPGGFGGDTGGGFGEVVAREEIRNPDLPDDEAEEKRNEIIRAQLTRVVQMPFQNDTPLEDFLKFVRSATQSPDLADGVPIYVDRDDLVEVDKSMASPISLSLEGVQLRRTLKLALNQLGLDYLVEHGMIVVMSPAHARLKSAAAGMGRGPGGMGMGMGMSRAGGAAAGIGPRAAAARKPAGGTPVDSAKLAALAERRLELALSLFSEAKARFQAGEMSMSDYTEAEKRLRLYEYAMAPTDERRIRILEAALDSAIRLEAAIKSKHEKGQVPRSTVSEATLNRMDIEAELIKLGVDVETRPNPAPVNPPAIVPPAAAPAR